MNWAKPLILSTLVVLVSCATTAPQPSFDPEQFSSLIEHRQFTEANIMLNKYSATLLSEQERIDYAEQLETASALYVDDLLIKTSQWEQQKNWYQAEQLYTQGHDALPESESLTHAYKAFSVAKANQMGSIRHQLKLHRAKMLPRQIELTHLLAAMDPRDERLQNKLYDMEREAESLVLFLTPLAQNAFAEGQYSESRKFDEQILLLGNSAQSRVRIAAVDAKKNQAAQRRANTRKQANKRKRDSLWSSYEVALQGGDFQQARQLLEQLSSVGFKGPIADEEFKRLNTLIDQRSTILVAEGKKYYTRGKLDAALNSWRQALLLKPEDQDLVARVKRAETFQANYQLLSR